MKTKTKKSTRTAPRRTASKPAPSVAPVPSDPLVFTETTATHVRFFKPGDDAPFSVIHNGPEGSENAAGVASALRDLKAQKIEVRERTA